LAKKSMPTTAIPTTEFTDEHKATLALAGTVALPSPFPASARIFVGIMPASAAGDQHYLKIVEKIGDKHTVTRLMNLDYLRAVRLRPASGSYNDAREWELKTAEELQAELATAKSKLPAKPATAHEVPLFPAQQVQEGVVYVPESAPVLVRAEYGVLAGEAADFGGYLGPLGGRACC
jgi:hypothetical protein